MSKDADYKTNIQTWLKAVFNDPFTQTLLPHCHLTKIQLESFLIDVLAPNIGARNITYHEKAKLRLFKTSVSRGAFNRTLKQARRNVIASIFTIILLSYLGIFETTLLNPYLEVGEKLQQYKERHKKLWKSGKIKKEDQELITKILTQIQGTFKSLSNPKSLSS